MLASLYKMTGKIINHSLMQSCLISFTFISVFNEDTYVFILSFDLSFWGFFYISGLQVIQLTYGLNVYQSCSSITWVGEVYALC